MRQNPTDVPPCADLVVLLQERAVSRAAHGFWYEERSGITRLTFAELDARARGVGAELRARHPEARSAILCYPPGLDFLVGFFGSLYAGVTAAPAYPPRPKRGDVRLEAIAGDSPQAIVLTTRELAQDKERLTAKTPRLAALSWMETCTPAPSPHGQRAAFPTDRPAVLQYTSGSTALPKGVMLTPACILHNLRRMREVLGLEPDTPGVCWLPAFHDMGLIGNLLQVIYTGSNLTLLSPAAVAQDPLCWLQAITKAKAYVSGGPSFAFRHCLDRIRPADRDQLDLSSWRVAYIGAEPVPAGLLERFTEAFAPCGFRPETFFPTYGLAECTLMVTGGDRRQAPVVRTFQSSSLETAEPVPNENGRAMVACGRPLPEMDVCIVDPATQMPMPPGQIGEIWVSGPSVAAGYWNRPEKSAHTFAARRADGHPAQYLRTGDLGFLQDELFITGRIKELIIIRGRNYYPQDLEEAVASASPLLGNHRGAAFTLDEGSRPRLVLVQEVVRGYQAGGGAELFAQARQTLAEHFELELHTLVLVRTATLPRSTSGKIQRGEAARRFQAGELKVIETHDSWQAGEPAEASGHTSPRTASARDIRRWLIDRLARQVNRPADSIDVDQPFAGFGLDSVTMVTIAADLEKWLRKPLPQTLLYDAPTIARLAESLAETPAKRDESGPLSDNRHAPIAIVGMGCRFPQADNPDEFWELLRAGRCAISHVPAGRWRDLPANQATHQAGFLADVEHFDAAFFGIAPREAVTLDPQHRLMLEVAWESLEHAGLAPDRLAGRDVGVFVGISTSDYGRMLDGGMAPDAYVVSGNALSMAAHRISYHLDLRGPSVAVDTACSSSLVAVHMACQALRAGECEVALAGGVNLLLSGAISANLAQAQMLSPSGRCKTLDADADGYVRGEGCGAVVLKPLAAALRDGDAIYAVIEGSAVNQDGRSNGITAPNKTAQVEVIRKALGQAGRTPVDISYVELHGTGTPLGDPIEFEAISEALGPDGDECSGERGYDKCAVGAVKTNVGHLEAASGIASLIKTVLQLHHGEIVPHLHIRQMNPRIPMEASRFRVPVSAERWAASASLCRAGVSAFGFGGTNAHVIVAQPPEKTAARANKLGSSLLPLSARSPGALRELAERYASWLREHSDAPLADVCATAAWGRAHFPHRLALVAPSNAEMADALGRWLAASRETGTRSLQGGVAFLFTGQGAQYAGMGLALHADCLIFRKHLDECAAILKELAPWSLMDVLADGERLAQTDAAQPALFALEYALARTWQAWGIEPAAVLGHSAGEYVAACIAGVFSLEDGLRLIVRRGAEMQACPEGAMLACFAGLDKIEPWLERWQDRLAVAAINGPESVVVAGDTSAIRAFQELLRGRGIACRDLHVRRAFHSALMEPALAGLKQTASSIAQHAPKLPMISNLSGGFLTAPPDGDYWARHARQPVRFADGMRALRAAGIAHFLEMGPHPVLTRLGETFIPSREATWLHSLSRETPDDAAMLEALARLYEAGASIRWDDVFDRRPPLALPTYPFQRQRFWFDDARPASMPAATVAPRVGAGTDKIPGGLQTMIAGLEAAREERYQLEQFAQARSQFDELAADYVARAFAELGWQPRPDEEFEVAKIAEDLGVLPRHQRLFERLLAIASEEGWLARREGGGRVLAMPKQDDSTGKHALFLGQFPEFEADFRLVDRCGTRLAAVLTGAEDPLQILFGAEAAGLVERMYERSPVAAFYNDLLKRSLEQIVAKMPADRPVRILELGAGTGGTTSHVLPLFPAGHAEYVFTDVSPLFLALAREKFKDHEHIEYRLLDLESPPGPQGFGGRRFDLVLASNVLHATSDLRRSLAHIRELLAPAGALALLEGTRPTRLLDLIFGLTEGWWKFADTPLRSDYPLLAPGSWAKLLREEQFTDVAVLPAGDGIPDTDQAVIIALAPPLAMEDAPAHKRNGHAGKNGTCNGKVAADSATAKPSNGNVCERKPFSLEGLQTSERKARLEQHLRAEFLAIAGLDLTREDMERPLQALGLDSLMAIQFRNRLEAGLGVSLSVVDFLKGLSLNQLLDKTLAQLSDSVEAAPSLAVAQTSALAENELPLTHNQQSLWFVYRLAPKSPAYNFLFAARISAHIHHAALIRAFTSIIRRHPALRVRFSERDNKPVQVFDDSFYVPIAVTDLRSTSSDDIAALCRQRADEPFDLERGPALRVELVRICGGESVLLLVFHHIIADLWSMEILLEELRLAYRAEVGGSGTGAAALVCAVAPFADYVRWHLGAVESPRAKKSWEYWHRELSGELPVLDLPTDRPRPPVQTYRGTSHSWTLDNVVVNGLRASATAQGATPFMALLAVFQSLLYRYSGQEDFLVGTAVADRGRPEWESAVGYFLNQLALRARVSGDQDFPALLAQTRDQVCQALDHQDFPFGLLVKRLQPPRDPSRPPIFQVMFIWDKTRTAPKASASGTDLAFEPLLMEQRGAPFELTFIIFETGDELTASLRYNTDLFDSQTIKRMAGHFNNLLAAVVRQPQTPVGELDMLSAEEKTCLLETWNNTAMPYAAELAFPQVFERQAAEAPDAPAILFEDRTLTYGEVNARANQLARYCRRRGVKRGQTIGLCLPRCPEAIIAVLAAWKLGAPYHFLDPLYPRKRLAAMLDDARPALVIARETMEGVPTIRLPGDCQAIGNELDANLETAIEPDDLAYIIYTSGSTGQPKGTLLRHRGLSNLAQTEREVFGAKPSDRILQFASLGFDASVFEIAMAFSAGASLVLGPHSTLLPGPAFLKLLRDQQVTIATLPPSVPAVLSPDGLPALHTLVVAGETCSAELVATWGKGRRMFNAYGPTEATVWSTVARCLPDGRPPTIGRPIANTRVYVLDANLSPVPVGVTGELYVAGPGLALGYLNKPELTAERFLANPFSAADEGIMYRTGDLVRWHRCGELEFLGRRDHQLKLRGYRIELEEIQQVLRQHSSVADALVVARPDKDGQPALAAYVVPRTASKLDMAEVRAFLREQLPHYMIPASLQVLEQLPLNGHGKVDRARLPAPSQDPGAASGLVPPRTPAEKLLAGVWARVLNVEAVGIHDNFFDLGGASMQTLEVVNLANQAGMKLTPEMLFRFQTIAELAQATENEQALPKTNGQCQNGTHLTVAGPATNGKVSRNGKPSANGKHAIHQSAARPKDSAPAAKGTGGGALIESLGTYLPTRAVTTAQVLSDCRVKLEFPLERMTGIQTRRMAGEIEFAIDLAAKAVADCLARSAYRPEDIDLLVCCNISRCDGPNLRFTMEPTTAMRLRAQFGFTNALAFDVTNACAGTFTAIHLVDALLRQGTIRRAMVVSGEYITHLTKTAQREIESFMDPRLACLTLGDSGMAMILEQAPCAAVGFQEIDLYTLGKYHDLCVAKASAAPDGGAIMFTDPVKSAAVTIKEAVKHCLEALKRHDWAPEALKWLIMHQTSAMTLDGAIREINRAAGAPVVERKNTIFHLAERGNTATNSHFLAVRENIDAGNIASGDKVFFAVSGSGQVVGSGLYVFDEMPERQRSQKTEGRGQNSRKNGYAHGMELPSPDSRLLTPDSSVSLFRCPRPVRIASIGLLPDDPASPADSVAMLRAAGEACFAQGCLRREDIDLVLHTGTYRTEFLCEPALAAIAAGELGINHDEEKPTGKRTFAFDLMNGSAGTLTGCFVASQLLGAGKYNRALVLASEVENNGSVRPDRLIGLKETASALILEEGPGFTSFGFRTFPEHVGRLDSFTVAHNRRTALEYLQDPDMDSVLEECIRLAASEFLKKCDLTPSDVRWLLPPQRSAGFVRRLAGGLAIPEENAIFAADGERDYFTSSLAHSFAQAKKRFASGDLVLIVEAAAGIQVACALYQV